MNESRTRIRAFDSWDCGQNLLIGACWIFIALGCSDSPSATPSTATGGTNSSGSGVTAAGASGGGQVASPSGGASAGRGASGAGNTAAGAASRDPMQVDAGADDAGTTGNVPPNGTDAATEAAPHSTGPGDWVPGDYPPNIMSDAYREISGLPGQAGNVRQYKVHIPPGYKPSVPAPVVFCIHGLGQDALLFCVTGTGMNAKSDSANFVLVMPNGYQNSWNAGTCCGGASSEELDDVALFRAIFKEVGEHVNIDLDRVYATGLSNGGYMSYRLACEAADIFTAVAPGAGAVGMNDIGGGTNSASDFTKCEPSRPVSVLDIHGTSDPLIPYSLQAKSLERMAMKNGCANTSGPASQPASGGDTTCVSYMGCPAGIELTGCSIKDGGHCWFGSPDCGTGGGDIGLAIVGANSDTMHNTDAVWDFFKRLSR
jgi:polyhydroxybutyrate depolymerase